MAWWLTNLAVTMLVFTLRVESKSLEESLRIYLQHFNSTRNNRVNPAVKSAARDYIVRTFTDHGLHTWSEEFSSNQMNYQGVNVIGRVPGRYTGTSQDKVLIVGAHYDSEATTHGVDDNGSGMAALLQVIKIYTSPDNLQCEQDYTLLFVAFDLEEWQTCANPSSGACSCANIGCGSYFFVRNISRYMNETGGELLGAYVLDTVMNYNTSTNSQVLPPGSQMLIPQQYARIAADQFRGNFLAVIARNNSMDDKLSETFVGKFKTEGDYKAETVSLPFSGRLVGSTISLMSDFLRSDHRNFWNHSKSWPAVFLTDTANLRGHMKVCYHEMCDDMRQVTTQMLTFLGRTTEALAGAASVLTRRECKTKKTECDDQTKEVKPKGKLMTIITSPYHPSKYPNGLDCVWVKDFGSGYTISIEEFVMERSANCTNDYLEIRDGKEANDPLLGLYCGVLGKATLDNFNVTSKHIRIRFRTDQFDAYKGFKITISSATVKAPAIISLLVSVILCTGTLWM